ncbi:MAG: alpha,alpha-phosphotrehalase [Peptostreptococcaceae bacterium]|jgi:trehalose-6-phosphate hydrolase|nr:alpha,alpha-phosphotrehalase [Peptostreptococcaceae bacterium]
MKDFTKSCVYQIYPKSFYDSNNDGYGDLKGVIEKLDYIKELGVDYIWLTPFYISPQNDNGYDVSDYKNIDSRFGTMNDFEKLVKEANKKDIDIMLDMVFNHTSTEHKWFKEALKGNEKYKNYYIFKNSKDDKAPTNWISKFGGSAWKYVKEFDEYYLHLFDETQADLNWENIEVRNEVYDIVNFWIQKGVKGFRLDVINLISKPKIYEDDYIGDGRRFYTDGHKIHDYLKELNKNTFGKYKDIITVGEMSSTNIENCIKYSSEDEKELSMVFNFHHLKVDYKDGQKWSLMDFDFHKLKDLFDNWQTKMDEKNAWNALFWCNHDQPRIVSRFGDTKKYHKESAKMLATSIHLMKGTPYIYQGEEIGMTNPNFDDINKYKDVESINIYNEKLEQGISKDNIMALIKEKSRDNSRTPIHWNDEINAGFSKSKPWLSISNNYKEINIKNSLEDKDSIFYHYKKLIKIRKDYDIVSKGDYKILFKEDNNIYAYIRTYEDKMILVMNNFYAKDYKINIFEDEFLKQKFMEQKYKNVEILISNYKDVKKDITNIDLRPYESIAYLIS